MLRFSPLYKQFRLAAQTTGSALSVGAFLGTLPSGEFDALSQHFELFHAELLDEEDFHDLLELSRNVAEDEGEYALCADETLMHLCQVSSALDTVRFAKLGLVHSAIPEITLSTQFATPTEMCVIAMGGPSFVRGTTVH
jgi:hypothetical protein